MEPVTVAQALNALFGIASLAIIALGLAVVLGLLGVLNLAHGELVMIGAYCAYVVQSNGLPYLAAVPLALVVCGVLGYVVERWLVRPLYQRPFDTLGRDLGPEPPDPQVRRSDVRARLQEPDRADRRHHRGVRRDLPALPAGADRDQHRRVRRPRRLVPAAAAPARGSRRWSATRTWRARSASRSRASRRRPSSSAPASPGWPA
jgi:hypothetical protein